MRRGVSSRWISPQRGVGEASSLEKRISITALQWISEASRERSARRKSGFDHIIGLLDVTASREISPTCILLSTADWFARDRVHADTLRRDRESERENRRWSPLRATRRSARISFQRRRQKAPRLFSMAVPWNRSPAPGFLATSGPTAAGPIPRTTIWVNVAKLCRPSRLRPRRIGFKA